MYRAPWDTAKSRTCTHRSHPNSRSQCGALLLKSVTLSTGKVRLYPFRVYCCQSLQTSLQKLLILPGFAKLCEHWRSLRSSSGEICDIYDGNVWKEFQYIDGNPALASQYVYAMMVNIDWFQPYKLTQSSVGAIYLSVLNLPYYCRFKRKNTILLGIIPGPSEPARGINSSKRTPEIFHRS